ncbi:MAG: CBS domain-containing protein [Spirochaetales bacterium]|nr:CBS domain-containing protein [Spirochaetales bacterium]MCF7938239.1 CBS domain-containing protein [Spirochaetales bacterium]
MRHKIRTIQVKEIQKLIVSDPTTILGDEPIESVLTRMIEDPKTRSVYVVNEENQVIGSVRLPSVVEYVFPYEAFMLNDDYYSYWEMFFKKTALEFMARDFKYVHDDTLVSEMIQIMIQNNLQELPVVDQDMHILGEANILETIAYFKNQAGENE